MNVVWLLLCHSWLWGIAFPDAAEKTKPLIVLITIDDLRPWIGAFGAPFMVTPALDSLCGDAWFYTNHYVAAPSCGPSRYAFLTGRYPSSWKDLDNNVFAHKRDQSETLQAVPESFVAHFRESGYYTIGIGKISHSPDGKIYGYEEEAGQELELPRSWDEMYLNAEKWGTGWNAFFGYADGSDRNTLNNQVRPYERGLGSDSLYADGWIAGEAVRRIRGFSKPIVPTLLAVGFFKPHLPFTAPSPYWKFYDNWEDTTHYALLSDTSVWGVHPNNEFNRYALGTEIILPDKAASPAYAQEIRCAYAASVSYVDAQVGKVITALKEEGFYEETIIVVWSDHGWHLGENGVWGKHTLFDVALRSPLIIKLPKGKTKQPPGEVTDVVSSVDVYPTLLAMVGLKPSFSLSGRNLLPRMEGEKIPNAAQKALSYWNRSISVRTPEFRFTKNYGNNNLAPMLFKLGVNKHTEAHNIAREYPEQLLEFFHFTGDPFGIDGNK
jgi:arylsulfatase A-like enzyme